MGKVNNLDFFKLVDNYTDLPIPSGQENISTALFNLEDVLALIKALPTGTPYIKISLILENDPNQASKKQISIGMTGADTFSETTFSDLNGDGMYTGLVADRPCPPSCPKGRRGATRYVVGG